MRKLRPIALLAVPALIALVAACEDSSSPPAGSFDVDASAGFDAGPLPDSAPPPPVQDAGTDVVVPPVPHGVSVTVTDGKTPQQDVRVIFQDATGAVTSEAKTDATGKASIATAPSMVTVLFQTMNDGTQVSNVTYLGVVDGDDLNVLVPSTASPPLVGTFNVTLTASALVEGSNFNTASSCSTTSVASVTDTASLPMFEGCLLPQSALLTSAEDAGVVEGFAFTKGLPKPAGDVAIGPLAFTAPGTTAQTASNIPALAASRDAQLFAIANGALFGMDDSSGALDEPGGLTYRTPTGFADAYQSVIGLGTNLNNAQLHTHIIRRDAVPAAGTPLAFDESTLLPLFSDLTVDSATPSRPSVTITAAASLATTDGGYAKLSWYDDMSGIYGQWLFVLPSSTTTFQVPALPADAAAFTPAAATARPQQVGFVESAVLPGFKELKQLPIGVESTSLLDGQTTALPANGVTVRATTWQPAVL